jgi:hypothetical protein
VIRAVAVLVAALMLYVAAPAAAQAEDLRTTAAFTAAAYVSTDEDIRLTLAVENTGTADAADVHVRLATDLDFDIESLGPLTAPGTTLAPGERVSIEVRLRLGGGQSTDHVSVGVETWAAEVKRGEQMAVAPLTVLRGSVSGVVYGDRDGDHVVDPGEELVGGAVSVSGGYPRHAGEARVGAGGVFAFPDLPAGHYFVDVSLPPFWQIAADSFTVPHGPTTWAVRAIPYVEPTLTASATFDRDSYPMGATVREHVVLTNTGTADLVGVHAMCEADKANMLPSDGWGELSPEGGVTLRPGETRTFDFTDVVPPNADRFGFILLKCWFLLGDGTTAAETLDQATVPGRDGAVTGELCQPDTVPCVPVPSLEVLVMDDIDRVVARTVAGVDGTFAIPVLPAGRYGIRFIGPWRLAPYADPHHRVMAGQTIHWRLDVVPGPTLEDPEAPRTTATPAPPPAPAPAARPRPARLADTGVDIGVPLALGVLLVLSGVGLLATRKARG